MYIRYFCFRCKTLLNRVGQNHTYTVYVRYFWQGVTRGYKDGLQPETLADDIFGREITKHTVIHGVDIRFWPTLDVICVPLTHQYKTGRTPRIPGSLLLHRFLVVGMCVWEQRSMARTVTLQGHSSTAITQQHCKHTAALQGISRFMHSFFCLFSPGNL